MVSNKLAALAAHMAAWAEKPHGVNLDQRVLLLLKDELGDAAEQVRNLENPPAGPAAAGFGLRLVADNSTARQAIGGAA